MSDLDELAAAARGRTPERRAEPGDAVPTKPPRTRNPVLWAFVAAAGVIGFAGTIWLLANRDDAPPPPRTAATAPATATAPVALPPTTPKAATRPGTVPAVAQGPAVATRPTTAPAPPATAPIFATAAEALEVTAKAMPGGKLYVKVRNRSPARRVRSAKVSFYMAADLRNAIADVDVEDLGPGQEAETTIDVPGLANIVRTGESPVVKVDAAEFAGR